MKHNRTPGINFLKGEVSLDTLFRQTSPDLWPETSKNAEDNSLTDEEEKFDASTSTPTPRMSIIIPNYNREDSLPLMLDAMELMSEQFKDIEIIVVDDGSKDRSFDIINNYSSRNLLKITLYKTENKGAGNARNFGIRHAASEIILFLDSDIIPTKEAIEEHLNFHRQFPEENYALRGRIAGHKDALSIRRTDVTIKEEPNKEKSVKEIVWADFRSSNISAKKTFLMKAGMFDGKLSAHQDTEIGHRMGKIGLRLFHSERALGFHYHPVNLKGYFKYALKYGKSRAIWYHKSPGLIEDLVKIGKEDRYGFISFSSPLHKKIKHLLKVICVNHLTHRAIVALGNLLDRGGSKHSFYFYRQAYQFYSRRAFKMYLNEIHNGYLPVTREPSIYMLAGPLPPEFSGAGIQSLRMSHYFKTKGFNITYLSPVSKKKMEGWDSLEGFPVCRFYRKNDGILAKLLFSLKIAVFLLQRRDQYDVIHMHGGGFLLSGAPLIAKILNKKSVYKMTSMDEDDARTIRTGRYNFLKFPLLRMADRVVAMSSTLRHSYQKCDLPEEKLCFIPNAVDIQKFAPVDSKQKSEIRKKLNIPENKFIVTTIGAICQRKRTDYLLEAWEQIISQHKDALLVLVGSFLANEMKFAEEIQRIIFQPNFIKNVCLAGRKENVEEYLQASDMFVFCSEREGFATVQIEAMACGLPCVCSSLPGISLDIFQPDKNAIIVNNCCPPQEFAQSMLRVMKDNKLRDTLSREARTAVINRFALEKIGDQYVDMYLSLLPDAPYSENVRLALP